MRGDEKEPTKKTSLAKDRSHGRQTLPLTQREFAERSLLNLVSPSYRY